MLEINLVRHLKSEPQIKALIGDRISPEVREDEEFPVIVYEKGRDEREMYLDGTYSDLRECSLLLKLFTTSFEQGKTLSASIEKHLTLQHTEMGDIQVDLLRFEGDEVQSYPDEDLFEFQLFFTIFYSI